MRLLLDFIGGYLMLPPFVFSTTLWSCYLVNQSSLAVGVVVIRYHVDKSTGYGEGSARLGGS